MMTRHWQLELEERSNSIENGPTVTLGSSYFQSAFPNSVCVDNDSIITVSQAGYISLPWMQGPSVKY